MQITDLNKTRFEKAIRARSIDDIIAYINKGLSVNTESEGIHIFDAVLSSDKPHTKEALDLILSHPNWNPNYSTVDSLRPEERAMLHHREEVAIRVIQHPNFDKKAYPRVIRSAERFQADKVIQFFADQSYTR